jgi:dGTPase
MEKRKRGLMRFLQRHFYHHPRVLEMSEKGARVLGELYVAFRDEPRHLPAHVRERFPVDGEARAVADYVAGMTDRFAMAEHWRILGSHEQF